MPGTPFLPPFPASWGATRRTLHAYARAVSAIPRAHAVAHPHWWHLGLAVRPEGLTTVPVPLPGGGALAGRLDPRRRALVLTTSTGESREFPLDAGWTGSEMGDRVTAAAADFGLAGGYDRERYADDEAGPYDVEAAAAFFTAVVKVAGAFEEFRARLDPLRVSPVQVWPHGFDMAFDWFGTRSVPHEDGHLPAQLNLGFYPGTEAYFYSNPWPLERSLLAAALPTGARWHTEGWEGAYLGYEAVRSVPDGRARLLEFAAAVHDLAAPTLEG